MTAISICFWPMAILTTGSRSTLHGRDVTASPAAVPQYRERIRKRQRRSGPVFTASLAARGMAIGDFNNDGAVDVLIAVNNGAPVLLRNNAGRANHWLGVRLWENTQSGCDRRQHLLAGARGEANPAEDGRGKLSCLA